MTLDWGLPSHGRFSLGSTAERCGEIPSSNFEQQLLQDRLLEIIEADGDVPESREHRASSGQRSRTCGSTSLAKISSDRMICACGNEPKSTSIPIWVMPTSRSTRMRSIACFGPPINTRPGK